MSESPYFTWPSCDGDIVLSLAWPLPTMLPSTLTCVIMKSMKVYLGAWVWGGVTSTIYSAVLGKDSGYTSSHSVSSMRALTLLLTPPRLYLQMRSLIWFETGTPLMGFATGPRGGIWFVIYILVLWSYVVSLLRNSLYFFRQDLDILPSLRSDFWSCCLSPAKHRGVEAKYLSLNWNASLDGCWSFLVHRADWQFLQCDTHNL